MISVILFLGASDEVQLGAFLHDIGHLIGIRGGKEKYPPMYDDHRKNIGTHIGLNT